MRQGQRTDLAEISAKSQGQVAELLNVSRDSVTGTLARDLRAGKPPERRQRERAIRLSDTGKNPERIERQRVNAGIWAALRDALTHLTALPLPGDVVSIAPTTATACGRK